MKRKLFLLVGLAFALTGMQTAQATIIEYNLNYEWSGATEPQGSSPWLTAVFDDDDTAGSVTLTMSASGLINDEFVTSWLFNVNVQSFPFTISEQDLLDNLRFSYDLSSTGPDEILINIDRTANSSDLNPARGFDIGFGFAESNALDRFEAGETVIYNIFGDRLDDNLLITANTFFAENESDKNGPVFRTVAHVQGIGPKGEDSGKIAPAAVPESSTLLLVGVGLIGLAGFGRRRFKA